jgi:CBS domain-containing protein
MQAAHLIKEKGDLVFTVGLNETLGAAAALLHVRRIGAMVIVDDRQGVVGILSERDIVREVAERGASALERPVESVMSREVITASPNDHVDELMARMTDRRIRHLPVVSEGRLVGIVSIGDLVKAKIAETEAEARELRAYIAAA